MKTPKHMKKMIFFGIVATVIASFYFAPTESISTVDAGINESIHGVNAAIVIFNDEAVALADVQTPNREHAGNTSDRQDIPSINIDEPVSIEPGVKMVENGVNTTIVMAEHLGEYVVKTTPVLIDYGGKVANHTGNVITDYVAGN